MQLKCCKLINTFVDRHNTGPFCCISYYLSKSTIFWHQNIIKLSLNLKKCNNYTGGFFSESKIDKWVEPRKKGSPSPVGSSYSQWEPWRKLSIINYKIYTVVLCLVLSEQINCIVFVYHTKIW